MELPFSICLHGIGFYARNVMLPAFPATHNSWGKITLFFIQSCQGDCLELPGHPPAGGVAELPWTLQFPVGEWIFHSMVVRTTDKPSSALKESFLCQGVNLSLPCPLELGLCAVLVLPWSWVKTPNSFFRFWQFLWNKLDFFCTPEVHAGSMVGVFLTNKRRIWWFSASFYISPCCKSLKCQAPVSASCIPR